MVDALGGSRWFPAVPGTGAERFPRTPTVPSEGTGWCGNRLRARAADRGDSGTGNRGGSEIRLGGGFLETQISRSPSAAPQRAIAARFRVGGAPVVLGNDCGRSRGRLVVRSAIAFWREQVQP